MTAMRNILVLLAASTYAQRGFERWIPPSPFKSLLIPQIPQPSLHEAGIFDHGRFAAKGARASGAHGRTQTRTGTRAQAGTHAQARTHARRQTHTCAHAHARTHVQAHAHRHTRTGVRTEARTHKYAGTQARCTRAPARPHRHTRTEARTHKHAGTQARCTRVPARS